MRYKRPPITEAIIELRFVRPFGEDVIKRAARDLQPEYTFRDRDEGRQIKIDGATGKAESEVHWSGERLSSLDRADILILRTTAFVSSRLAPYLGWEQYIDRTLSAWRAWRKAAGAPIELSRVGVRYVNRIDIPSAPNEVVQIEDYLQLYPKLPEGPPMTGYAMQVTRSIGADNCNLILNSASVVAPMIGFISFAVDLDIYRETDLPRRDEELFQLLNQIRVHKNGVFESCITERSRVIFQE
jgi:uncharacterized protein (TIGR04255 family)